MLGGVDAALAAAARGLALFALPPGGRRPAPGWQRRTTTDPQRVAVMAAAGNLGVGCRASDVVGIDLDRRGGDVDGIAAFAATCASSGECWPDTFTVRTPHGLHLYFAARGRPVLSRSGGRSGLGPGIDTRGPGRHAGGYLLAPGSCVAALPYVITRDVPVAPLPTWLADRLLHPEPAPGARESFRRSHLSGSLACSGARPGGTEDRGRR